VNHGFSGRNGDFAADRDNFYNVLQFRSRGISPDFLIVEKREPVVEMIGAVDALG
jgi:hypothetical protein